MVIAVTVIFSGKVPIPIIDIVTFCQRFYTENLIIRGIFNAINLERNLLYNTLYC